MRQTNVRGNLSLRGFRKLRTGAIVATGVILLGLGFLAPTVSANEQDGVWVARTVAEVKADIQKEGDLFKYVIKWGDTLSVISEASNIPVDVLQEMNQASGKNLFLPHNELYFTEAETVSDTVTKHKIVIKESGASGEVRTYEVLLKKDQETKAVTFELTDVTEKVEKMTVNYSPVYQPVSAPIVKSAEESVEELAPVAPAVTSPEVKEETEAPVVPKAEEAATTPAPKSEEKPATPAPKSEEPVAPAPKAEEPTTPAPKSEEPATPAPKVEEPAATTPKSEEPATPAPVTPSEETPVTSGDTNSTTQPAGETGKSEIPSESSNTPSADATNESGNASESSSVTDDTTSNVETTEQPETSAPKTEATAPKAEEPTASVPKDDESASSVTSPSTGNHSEESGTSSTIPTGDSTATQPSDSTSSPVAPSEETPVASGDTNSTTQPAGETGNSETTAEPSNTPSADATNESGNAAESSSVTDNAPSNTGAADQPVASNSSSESPATSAPKAEEPASPAPKAEEPAPSEPVAEPKAEELTSEEVKAKKELADSQKEGEDIINERVSSKLAEIEKVKDEAKKEKLKEELKTLKEEALAAIKNAENHDAAVDATDEYQTKIDEINVPGEELPAPNYNKDNLTNGRNEGTTIDNGSTAIGHGSGEAPTQPASEERTTSTASPTQPSSTSEGASSFRNAPSVQARARRVARSTSEPDGTVNISYNFAGMPDIHGFLSDPGENNTVTIPAGTSEAQAKELVKEKIQAKIKDLAARGYHVKNDIIFEQDTTVKNYNYVVTFTKEATGTSGFRMAPAVQPRASRNRRSIEQPAPQKVKVNVFYNFDQMKDIAGFLGDINGTSLEIAEGLSNEQVKAAVKSQVEAKKEELSKRGYTFKEDYVYQANGKDYNYVVTFSKAAK